MAINQVCRSRIPPGESAVSDPSDTRPPQPDQATRKQPAAEAAKLEPAISDSTDGEASERANARPTPSGAIESESVLSESAPPESALPESALPESALPESAANLKSRMRYAMALVQAAVVLGLVWKLGLITPSGIQWKRGFFLMADEVYLAMPLDDSFFPDWLRSVTVLRFAYITAVATMLLSWLVPVRIFQIGCLGLSLFAHGVLCVHQGSYNDATFTTSFWVTLWLLWFATRINDANQMTTLWRGAFLSRLILSMILLGGAVGKWTAEYWSGDVLYDIYFIDRDQWLFNYFRDNYGPETLRQIATWHSRQVVLIETLGGLGLWLLPARWAAVIGVLLFFSIAAFSNFWLFSVTWSLVGLASVGFWVPRKG